jgi:hypothetical protein
MPFSENFSMSQAFGLPSVVTATDTSTGSDGNIASRRITLTTYNGSTLVPSGTTTSYVSWPLLTNPLSIDALDKDYALSIKVDWLDSGGNILYTKTQLYQFSMYNEEFYYSLTSRQSSVPAIIMDNVYYMNKLRLRVDLDSAQQAVTYGEDISSAQYCLDAGTELRLNQNKYF